MLELKKQEIFIVIKSYFYAIVLKWQKFNLAFLSSSSPKTMNDTLKDKLHNI